jgi:hypothetical protein
VVLSTMLYNPPERVLGDDRRPLDVRLADPRVRVGLDFGDESDSGEG